ncbi:maleylpyruvate isomerase family mycothiol-dependent enzyme [Streptomyces sp. DSM 41527]|uniref:Maleylpyruvate isomerase family mycothiol-dependent enzyme n=1 Tax=Streptomyces mooreae TaxID=3075523 RepID=A0ABU2T6L1_9ACTN|nr:maleylpyruvate isomerase family mycothiol-dependent enzyme [Streptomyces sp. DSM 41527]MDT0456670.1 maleylpyruvate isomerase family mycothiol-dependent enzyme [Streptomyces sp. DSM 41527]
MTDAHAQPAEADTHVLPAEAVRAATETGRERLRALLPALTDDEVREPSELPGWTRAHVLSHIEGVALALARQARYALRGELTEPYDGGRPARAAAIEAGAVRGAAALGDAVRAALSEASAAWAAVGPADWRRPVKHRNGDLRSALLAWWRELEIHTADARIGHAPRDWPRELCHHLLDHLSPRVPEDPPLVLTSTDDTFSRRYGAADAPAVTVSGPLTDLAAWLAGRTPHHPLDCRRSGRTIPPPELLAWP